MKQVFVKVARSVSAAIGTPYAFLIALASIILWACLGPMFGFSETWQLVVNTGTTIITFLVVFLIQATQNKDARAVHIKLDELIHVIKEARNQLIDCEELSDRELTALEAEFRRLGRVSGRDEQGRRDRASTDEPAPTLSRARVTRN